MDDDKKRSDGSLFGANDARVPGVHQTMTTCCFCLDIKTGTNAIGALFQPILILTVLITCIGWGHYFSILLNVCPLTNMYFFCKMARLQNEETKLNFYRAQIGTTTVMTCAMLYLLVWHNVDCNKRHWHRAFTCEDWARTLSAIYFGVIALLQIYFVFVSRQNWVNYKMGIEDSGGRKESLNRHLETEYLLRQRQETFSPRPQS